MPQTDFLTGYLSRESIDPTLDRLKAECSVNNSHFSLLVLDIDHFKTYNDKYGHLFGDDMLRYFTGTLRMCLESVKTFMFRFGGDEFIIVFPGKSAKEAHDITLDIFNIMKKRPFLYKQRMYNVSFSAGIATYPISGRETDEIISNADKAMYFSKTHGRGRVTIYEHISRKNVEKKIRFSVCILLAMAVLLYFSHSPYKRKAMHWLKRKMAPIGRAFMRQAVKIDAQDPDLIYLKSGRILSGTIVRDDADGIEFSLNLDSGRGTVSVKRSEIDKVGRR